MHSLKRFKTYFYSFSGLIMLLASVFTLPSTVVYSAAGDPPPTVSIDSPAKDAFLNFNKVTISGNFTDDVASPPSNPVFTAYDSAAGADPISDSSTKSSDWTISNDGTSGTWSFQPTLTDGPHTITVAISEQGVTNVDPASITFTIDTKRPYISSTEIFYKDSNSYTVQSGDTLGSIAQAKLGNESYWTEIAQLNNLSSPEKDATLSEGTCIDLPSIQSGEDLTSIPPDAIIKVQVTDDNPMDQLVSNINSTSSPYNPVKVMLDTTEVNGTASILENRVDSGKHLYDVFFKSSDSFVLNKNYLVYLDPNLLDDSNNHVYAKFFKFTTKSNSNWDDIDDQSHDSANPHGHYQLNTNMCAACHSTHVDSPFNKGITNQLNPSREGGSYLIDFNQKLDVRKLSANASENYCTACHDGTLNNAPIVNGIKNTYHHDNPADYDQTNGTNNLKEATSCTSCHNPHLEWSSSNPNLLKDHYVYTHKPEDQGQNGLTDLVVDSLDTTCETCHQDDLIHDNSTNTVSSIYTKNQATDGYNVLSYKKSLTATGALSDYSLCLRCHQANKAGTDIQSYYLEPSSGHNFTLPSDDGGSQLNGPLPCAECHETHGSNNIKMLRSQLGNVQSDITFSSTGSTWSIENERKFCLSCHSNSTEIYGKTAIFNTTDTHGNSIAGHQIGDTDRACSGCHSSSYNKDDPSTFAKAFMEAAHAPKQGIPNNDGK